MHRKVKGIIELGISWPEELEAGDSITDNDGQGRTVYVNQCSTCKKLMLGSTRILVPVLCSNCIDFYDKLDNGYFDWVDDYES